MNVSGHISPSPVDIRMCGREPIHIPGAIQPHGFLLALDAATWAVRYASENVENYLRINAAAAHPLFTQRALFVAYVRADDEKGSASFCLLAHRYGGGVILEGEAIEGEL